MRKVWYFGTVGCVGHQFKKIEGPDMTYAFIGQFEREIDDEKWQRQVFNTFLKIKFHGRTYFCGKAVIYDTLFTVFAVPWSRDDHRGGSHTELFIEGDLKFEEVVDYILSNRFLTRQFRLCDIP